MKDTNDEKVKGAVTNFIACLSELPSLPPCHKIWWGGPGQHTGFFVIGTKNKEEVKWMNLDEYGG